MGGKFTLSDDSHGVAQVGLNFNRIVKYLNEIGVKELYYPGTSVRDAEKKWVSQQTLIPLPLKDLSLNDYPAT
jgi:histidinol phosphatase-like PHP family hydrolase